MPRKITGTTNRTSGFVNLPPRIEIRNRDNATGSYPTTLRMGDKDRRGSYSTQFDDTNTIFFGRRINDNFELTDKIKVGGVMNYSKTINSKLWTHSTDMEIRRETFVNVGGGTALDGALVFTGPGDGAGRWIQTREKIKNPILEMDVIQGPYNQSRTVLGAGLGLENPGSSVLKVQASLDGSSWEDIKEIPNNAEGLFLISAFSSRTQFEELLRKRKRVSIKISIQEFSIMKGGAFYLRIIEEAASISDPSVASWAIGKINIDYHNEEVNYPLMIDVASRVGQRVASGAIATPHTLPTLTAPGRSISGISDVHLKFTPGEGISAFDDSRINIAPENFFFQQGSDPEEVRGLSSPLWSKTQFVVDLSPNEETTFGMTSRATTTDPYNETDDTVKQQLMVYWNNNLKRWEKIAQGISANAPNLSGVGSTANLKNMIASGALGFSNCDLVATGASSSDLIVNSSNILNSYARPTTVFGFPFEGKYHATGSQIVKARDLGITKPFVLEKCQISFDSKFEFAEVGSKGLNAFSLKYGYATTSASATHQQVIIPTFFILRQQPYDNFSKNIDYKVDVMSYIDRQRNITIPGSSFRLSTDNEETSYVESSRETITYGQVSMFTSSSGGINTLNLREVLDKGLSRDAEIDILKLTGQSNASLAFDNINPLTGSFLFNFPSRLTGKINGGARFIVAEGTDKTGLWLNNSLGGRSYADLDTFARSLTSGTPGLKFGENFTNQSTNSTTSYLEVSVSSADSTDIYSPYIIMPEDEIIFGWQYPLSFSPYFNSPGSGDSSLNAMTLFGNSKLTLFGSQLKDNIEFHETNNQNLGSDAVHEIIGSEPVVDQFEISRAIENFGNYLDNYVATTAEEPVDRVLSLVQSRLTTPKGQGGAASATIQFPPKYFFPTPNNPGMNDGDMISIKDGLGQVGHFYALRYSPFYPLDASGSTPKKYDSDDDNSVDTLSVTSLWASPALAGAKILHHFTKDAIPITTGFMYGHRFSFGPPTTIQYPDAGGAGDFNPGGLGTPDFIYAFKIEGGDETGTGSSESDRLQTLQNLLEAIEASPLRMTGEAAALFPAPRLTLTLTDAGAAAQHDIVYSDAKDDLYSGLQDDYDRPSVTGFSGAVDLLDSSLGSFVRISPTQDSARVYTDSLLTNSDIGFSNSSFGTMQTSGGEIRPKYYLDSRKYGQSSHFLEQGKDSKSDFNLKTRRNGLLNVLKGESLGAPVRVEFVTGSTSDSTAIRRFRRSLASQSTSVNKTINSVLTGAFYDA